MFGSPETTTGGKALKFYASIRIDIRKIDSIKSGTEIVGNRVKVKIVKNKVAAPFKICEFDIMYGKGISKEGSLIDLGVAKGIIEKSGSWFSYNSNRIGQGRDNVRQYLLENPTIADEIDKKLRVLIADSMPKPDDTTATDE